LSFNCPQNSAKTQAGASGGSRGRVRGVWTPPLPFFYYLLDTEILASTGSPMTTQLVGLFFDGKPLDFSTNLNSRHNFHNEMFLAIPSDGHSPLLTKQFCPTSRASRGKFN